MSSSSSIEWTNATWNPVTGCTKNSAGCAHCYAERFAERWRGIKGHPYEQGFDLKRWPARLDLPLHWKQPRFIFVNSMSDLFHEKISLGYIQEVFTTIRHAHWHKFQMLTKRAGRLAELAPKLEWPSNLWMGVTVENRKSVERIECLRNVPAAVRFLSVEPLLEPLGKINLKNIDWVIVGGESGPGARPMEKEWVIEIRDQCLAKGVPFFFKQWGGFFKKRAGRKLEGRVWNEMPVEVMRKMAKDKERELVLR
jgi:protein gp37